MFKVNKTKAPEHVIGRSLLLALNRVIFTGKMAANESSQCIMIFKRTTFKVNNCETKLKSEKWLLFNMDESCRTMVVVTWEQVPGKQVHIPPMRVFQEASN